MESLGDDPADPGVGAVDVDAENTTEGEAARLRALGWSPVAIAAELRRQGRADPEIAACVEGIAP